MQLSLSSALAAFLLTGDVFVNAACPPGVYRHRQSKAPAGATPAFPWPSGFFSTPAAAALPSSDPAPVAPVPSPSSTLATVVVPAATTSSSSTSAPVAVPTTTTAALTPTSSTAAAVVAAAAAPAATSAASSPLTADEQGALDTQNGARSDVGAAALAWDAGLVADAQAWADHLAAQSSAGSLVHDAQSAEGENLYWQSNADAPFENAAAAWVAEKSSYSGEAIGSGSFESYGHYTQIIWASTTKVGMAVSSDGQGGYYVVARYSPAGNVVGETPSTG